MTVPGIAVAIQGGTPAIAAGGALLALASMLIITTIFRHGLGARP
jgi:hypothetical protein